jgi:D-sedoheptulose 7-phosphate isomerase
MSDVERQAAEQAARRLGELADAARETARTLAPAIARAVTMVRETLEQGGTLFFCGNGGSAADAQHVATEYVVRYMRTRRALPAVALTTDTSLLTAVSNDFGVERIFARQVEALGREGDVLIAISTSGNSANVLRAAEEATTRGLRVVGLTGASGGRLAPLTDVCVRVPSTVTAHIQECHIAVEQLIALLVERDLYPDPA